MSKLAPLTAPIHSWTTAGTLRYSSVLTYRILWSTTSARVPFGNVVEERDLGLDPGQSGTAGRPERGDARFLQHADDLDVVDVPVGVHVAPAHRH